MGSTPCNPRSFPLLSRGISGLVRTIDDNTVLKHPISDGDYERDHIIERRIYERLGGHPRIVKLISFQTGYIVLERLKYPLRQHFYNLHETNSLPSPEQALKWSHQAAEGIQYLHSKSVFQADIGTHNLLLDSKEDIKFCDFAGSSIDGEIAWVCPSSHAEYPFTNPQNYQPTVKSELFSLGSIIYEISTTRRPYDEKRDSEVEKLFRARQFPETETLLLGPVILKCWRSQYFDAGEVLVDIEQILTRRSSQDGLSKSGQSKIVGDQNEDIDKGSPFSINGLMLSSILVLATVAIIAARRTRYPTSIPSS